MIIDLPSTTTSQVNAKLVQMRQEGGAVTLGRVLTLVIVSLPILAAIADRRPSGRQGP